ncbi:MAG TPA: hypothetical protein VGI39_21285 [Polyangiaceae bacterium]|jgi:hypothetical protein
MSLSLRNVFVAVVTVCGLVGCASADGQSSPVPSESEGASAEHAGSAAVERGGVGTELSYLAQCNARCVAAYDRALASCDGDSVCLCFAQQNEGACLAQCQGRPYFRHAC